MDRRHGILPQHHICFHQGAVVHYAGSLLVKPLLLLPYSPLLYASRWLGAPQPWTVHCLVTKKSADAQFSKSLYLPHNKSNQSEASNCCFVVDHKIGRARSLFFSHFCSHYFPCKLCLKNICWFHIFVMGQI